MCAIYTVISFAVTLLSATIIEKPALTLRTMGLFIFMSFLISCSGYIFDLKRITIFLRTMIHMLLCLLSVIVSLYIFGHAADLSVDKLLLSVFFCILYLIIAVPIVVIHSSNQAKKAQSKEYTPMFRKK